MLAELLCSVDISADYKNISGNCNCNCKLMNAAEVLRIDGEVEGDREQELGVDEVQQQPRRFGRRWANFVSSLLDDARM